MLKAILSISGKPGLYKLVSQAKNMLITSNYSISEIAISVGYSDPYYFSRVFKQEIGIAPSEYKKRNGLK